MWRASRVRFARRLVMKAMTRKQFVLGLVEALPEAFVGVKSWEAFEDMDPAVEARRRGVGLPRGDEGWLSPQS